MGRRKTLLEQLGDKMLVGDDCWEWTGTRREGYGQLRVGDRMQGAHRIVYELLVGPIPEGLQIDHLCRNRGCVNPAHMEPVTQRENVLRGAGPTARHAMKTHCPQGHALSGENLALYAGRRNCMACRREQYRTHYENNIEKARAQARVRTARYRARLKAT